MTHSVCILGIFVADLTFVTASDLPRPGETVLGGAFRVGPGGKGSNQAIAARRAGAEVDFIAKIGADTFGDMAHDLYAAEGISDRCLIESKVHPTGAAGIHVSESTGENAIVVTPSAAGEITVAEVEAREEQIAAAAVFVSQFEVPLAIVETGLRLAKKSGVRTILNPAPATRVDDTLWPLADIVTPNETEAEMLTGIPVHGPDDAAKAADAFLERGVGTAVVTLGSQGVYLKTAETARHFPAIRQNRVVETTGAGDAFNGALAAALAEGQDIEAAVAFANAAAALSVTRPGTAASMPKRAEIDQVLAGQSA